MIKFVLVGEKQLIRKLEGLPVKLQDRVLKSAAHNAVKPVLSAARRRVSTFTRLLYKALGIKSKLYRASHTAVALVGARSGFAQRQTVEYMGREITRNYNPVRYSHLVESGTRAHAQPKLKIEHPGAKAKPFLKPGYEEARAAASARFSAELRKGLDRIARRAAP